ncbi:hypothetical protein ACQYWY_21745 [Comamonas sediminis]|uniref:hypothetical protein n=1 Tax=Comamonas sediminis TaxID=1783360 RepID=UPI003D2DCC36
MNMQITTYLKEKLTEVGTGGFEKLADDTGVKVSFIRKFFYGNRPDPRVKTVQPLLDHFQKLDCVQNAPMAATKTKKEAA